MPVSRPAYLQKEGSEVQEYVKADNFYDYHESLRLEIPYEQGGDPGLKPLDPARPGPGKNPAGPGLKTRPGRPENPPGPTRKARPGRNFHFEKILKLLLNIRKINDFGVCN